MCLSRSSFSNFCNVVVALRLQDYIACFIIGFGGWLLGRIIPPYCRSFSWGDVSINSTFTKDVMFPSWTLAPISILPILTLIIVEIFCFFILKHDNAHGQDFNQIDAGSPATESGLPEATLVLESEGERRTARISFHENGGERRNNVGCSRWGVLFERVNDWIIAHVFSVTLCMFVVDITKVVAGRLRPDFLSRLRNAGYDVQSHNVDWCNVAREGRLSFPSGHSGISFASFVPLVMYLLVKLQVFRDGSVWRCIIGLLPLFFPVTVAVSRTRDNRQFFSDILGGSVIGVACAILSVKVIFHSANHTGRFLSRRRYLRLTRPSAHLV